MAAVVQTGRRPVCTCRRSTVVLGLFLLLFGLYLITASGHTYSPDEEAILYVTQAFVTRGDFDIPSRKEFPVVGGWRGQGGKIYSGTGVVTSLMLVPLYVVGEVVSRAFEPQWRDYLIRLFVVSLFNSALAALSALVFYAWLRRLGAQWRGALGLALGLGLATMTWIYARTLYSETLLMLWMLLAGYSVRAYHDARESRWMLVAGLAAGLAILTKLQGALVLPALALYFILLEFPRTRSIPRFIQAAIRPTLFFLAALGVCLLFLAYYNFIRFGDIWESGYGRVEANYPLWRGLYGQLLSSGKSVFLYAPPVVLGVLALPMFFRRYAAEALLCVTLIAAVLLFHARVPYWAGDGAWGPRYLAATMPFWLLPFGGVLHEWWRPCLRRAIVIALLIAGVLVNVLGASVNWDTFIQMQPNANARYFDAAVSPLVGQWELLRERVHRWGTAWTAQNALVLVRGFLHAGEESFPRYLASRAKVWVKSDAPATLELFALDYRSDDQPKRTLAFYAKGVELQTQRIPRADAGELEYRVQVGAGATSVEIVTCDTKAQGKGEALGVHLQALSARTANGALALYDLAIPPAPLTQPRELWGWFFRPTYAHFDHFAWYLFFSGMEDSRVVALTMLLTAGGLVCVVGGGWRILAT